MSVSQPHLQRMLEDALGRVRAGEWAGALDCWEGFTRSNPDLRTLYMNLARELRDLGGTEAAESVFRKMLDRFPEDPEPALDYAMMAYSRGDFPEALRRFEFLRSRHPDTLDGYRFVGALLTGEGEFHKADMVLREAMARFPEEPRLAISYAWSAHFEGDRSGNWLEAGERWRSLVTQFPRERLGYSMLGFVLTRHLGRAEEAESLLAKAMDVFPDDLTIASEHARAADYRQDWEEALRRWNALLGRWPGNQTILEGRGETETRKRFHQIDSPAPVSAYPVIRGVVECPTEEGCRKEAETLMHFESLGENCEFGLLQRHFGAEPLGLLRWVSMPPESLCLALEERFAGLEEPHDLEVRLSGAEYYAYGNRYQMRMHTFIVRSEYKGSVEQLHTQLYRRLRYLRDKLLEDLRSAEKIFVWQSGVGSTLSDGTVLRLHRALSRYGDNTLLVVRRHDDPTARPSLTQTAPGLLLGSLHQVDRVSDQEGSIKEFSPFDSWLSICRQALNLCAGSLPLNTVSAL